MANDWLVIGCVLGYVFGVVTVGYICPKINNLFNKNLTIKNRDGKMTIKEAITLLDFDTTNGALNTMKKYMPNGFDYNKGIELTKEAQRIAVKAMQFQLNFENQQEETK